MQRAIVPLRLRAQRVVPLHTNTLACSSAHVWIRFELGVKNRKSVVEYSATFSHRRMRLFALFDTSRFGGVWGIPQRPIWAKGRHFVSCDELISLFKIFSKGEQSVVV